MKTAVVFAASIFESDKMFVLHEFFHMFQTYFSDADFYVGLNYGSMEIQKDVIKSYIPNVQFIRLEKEHVYCKMDTSATQTAFKLLQDCGKTYDVYWFAHTKGGTNERGPGIRRMYFNEFFSQRIDIEKMFETYPHLGTWGLRAMSVSPAPTAGNSHHWKDLRVDPPGCVPICSNEKVDPFNYTHINYSYIETMFAMRGVAVEAYAKAIKPEYFDIKLFTWYAENVFPWIPSRCGYFPYVKRKMCFWEDTHCNLLDVTKQWIDENNLHHLDEYLKL
jgi:hypothetical protein